MSPRPAPTRDDPTARHFLDTAADLIDLYLQAEPPSREKSARLRQIRFPAALEWLRITDIIRLARVSSTEGGSRKAFFNRWPTKDDFLADAVVHAAMREHTVDDPRNHARQMSTLRDASSFAEAIIEVVDGTAQS